MTIKINQLNYFYKESGERGSKNPQKIRRNFLEDNAGFLFCGIAGLLNQLTCIKNYSFLVCA